MESKPRHPGTSFAVSCFSVFCLGTSWIDELSVSFNLSILYLTRRSFIFPRSALLGAFIACCIDRAARRSNAGVALIRLHLFIIDVFWVVGFLCLSILSRKDWDRIDWIHACFCFSICSRDLSQLASLLALGGLPHFGDRRDGNRLLQLILALSRAQQHPNSGQQVGFYSSRHSPVVWHMYTG